MSYVKDSYFVVSVYDLKVPRFIIYFDLDNIDFVKLYNEFKNKNRDVDKYLLFRKILKGELLITLLEEVTKDSKQKILDAINEYCGPTGILDREARDFVIVDKGYKDNKVYFIVEPTY